MFLCNGGKGYKGEFVYIRDDREEGVGVADVGVALSNGQTNQPGQRPQRQPVVVAVEIA